MTIYAPNIVKNGIMACWDAAGKRSYPGTGTTWYDMSGNGNDATLTSGPTFDPANGGGIVLDGTDDYISTSVARTTSEPFTIELYFKISSWTSTDMRLLGAMSGSTDQLGTGWNDDGDEGIFRIWKDSWDETAWVASVGTYMIDITHDNTTTDFYLNGDLNSAGIDAGLTTYFDNLGFGSTFVLSYGSYFDGTIYFIRIYNRALTAAEVRQNYLATRGRFSL